MSEVFNVRELAAGMQGQAAEYLEFLGLPSLNCGIYHLRTGAEDPQSPHDSDEVYYVLSGEGEFESDTLRCHAGPGTIIFVPAHEPHRFTAIVDDLRLLVIFSGVVADMGVEEIEMD